MKYLVRLIIWSIILLIAFYSCAPEKKGKKEQQINESIKLANIAELNKEISQDSTNPDLYNLRAKYHIRNKNINKAFSDINQAIQLDNKNPTYFITLSDIYLAMSNSVKCESSLKKAYQLDKENINALLKLGELNFILKKYEDAINYLNKAIKKEKNNPTPYLIKGYAYLEGGDTSRAIENFRISIDKDQNTYDAHVQLGIIFSRKEDPIAVDYFNNALNINPQSIEALYGLAIYYQNIYNAEKAIENYQKIIDVNPDFKYAHYNMGYINLVYLEKFLKAIEHFTNAIEIDPEYAKAYYNRGYCYELTGNYDKARSDYRKSLEFKTNYEQAIKGLNRLDKTGKVQSNI